MAAAVYSGVLVVVMVDEVSQAEILTRQSPTPLILLLAIIFLIPLLASYGLYQNAGSLDLKTKNHGLLIEPPLKLETLGLLPVNNFSSNGQTAQADWQLLYFTSGQCLETCRKALLKIEQVRRALGKVYPETTLLLVISEPPNQQTLRFVASVKDKLSLFTQSSALSVLSHNGLVTAANESLPIVLLADAEGQLIMGFPGLVNQVAIYEDLRWLIKARRG